MANPNYVPLRLDLIEQGRFTKDVDKALRRLQRQLCLYADEHGERADKAKGELTLKISLVCLNAREGQFAVKTDMTAKSPTRPTRATVTFQGEDDNGQPCLFTRASGTTQEPPQQRVLCTEDGDLVDTKTGEVVADSGQEVPK